MNKVKIVVDSTVDLNQEDYKNLDIHVIPLWVRFNGKEYLDGVDITPDEIYKYVDNGGELPSTATISTGQFEEEFKKLIDQGFDIVYVGIGAKLSGTFQAATIAANECPEGRVYLVDSMSLSSGSGLLVVKGAKLRDQGMCAKEIADNLSELAPKVVSQFGIDRLDYMAKGGRCSGFANIMARLFHIHPLLRVVDGKLIVYRKPRGKREAYFDELLNLVQEDMPIHTETVFITSSGIDDEAIEYIRTRLEKLVPPESIKVTRAGAIISCHCGRGTLGILYIKK